MKRIGLTGGIATGKSLVTQYLRGLGHRVIDSDELARQVVEPGTPGLAKLTEAFGSQILQTNGQLDRARLGQLIFQDEVARQQVNTILHPLIFAAIEQTIEAVADTDATVWIDMPLLYEVGYEARVDQVWVVYVPENLQRERLMRRNQWTYEQAEAAIASQWPIEQKRQRADWVIDNQGTPEVTYQQIEKQLEELS